METPLQIDFQGMDAEPKWQAVIVDRIAELETRFGRITAGRVVVRAPSGHHTTGGLYEVRIHLDLPEGRTVSVSRTPTPDERHGQLAFAINDAFKRARRQLQTKAQQMRPHAGDREHPPIGTVIAIDGSGEFGFLEAVDGRRIYFHANSLLGMDIDELVPGERVVFHEERGDEGPQASTVKPLGKHALR